MATNPQCDDLRDRVPHQPPPRNLLDEPFWSGARDEVLRLPRCVVCMEMRWYVMATCAACGTDEQPAWIELSGRAELFTWTHVVHPFVHAPADFHVGLFLCDGAEGARLVAPLIAAETRPVIGSRWSVDFVHLETHSLPVFRLEGSDPC